MPPVTCPISTPSEVAEVNEMLGEVAELGGRYDIAVAAYARARRLRRDDPVQLAGLCVREGHLRERSGRAGEALGWFTRGRRVARRRRRRRAQPPTPAERSWC